MKSKHLVVALSLLVVLAVLAGCGQQQATPVAGGQQQGAKPYIPVISKGFPASVLAVGEARRRAGCQGLQRGHHL
jgi:Flp pilus assembly protein CpaB